MEDFESIKRLHTTVNNVRSTNYKTHEEWIKAIEESKSKFPGIVKLEQFKLMCQEIEKQMKDV